MSAEFPEEEPECLCYSSSCKVTCDRYQLDPEQLQLCPVAVSLSRTKMMNVQTLSKCPGTKLQHPNERRGIALAILLIWRMPDSWHLF